MAEEQKDSETKERLLACAKKEFVEKGYAKASLRAICREAGVTTGQGILPRLHSDQGETAKIEKGQIV